MKKWTLSSLAAIFLLSTAVASPAVSANSLNDLQQEKKMIEDQKIQLNSGIKQKEIELTSNKSSIESITEQIKTLDAKVEETMTNIQRVEEEIAETTKEIEALQVSIIDLEVKIAERDVVLRDRVRAMQVTGGTVNYLDVLLRANSFSDFIDRFSAVTTLLDADRNIMQQQADDVEQLEQEKALVEEKLAEQETSKNELLGLKASLDSQKQEKNTLVKQLEEKQKKINAEKNDLEFTYEAVHEISNELEQEIVAEQTRIAEIARIAAEDRKRKAAEAAQVAQAAEASRAAQASKVTQASKATRNSGSSSSSSSSSSSAGSSSVSKSSAPSPSVSSGSWTKPANGRTSSGFGWRIHPISGQSSQHRGADIANSTGTPIVAAGDGVVSRAQSHSSYGNHIMITHVIDGQTYTTLYAHLSSMGVSPGQHVSKGQVIGKMGSTGNSTGPHLHFEFHIGYYSGYGPSAVNPRNYVPM